MCVLLTFSTAAPSDTDTAAIVDGAGKYSEETFSYHVNNHVSYVDEYHYYYLLLLLLLSLLKTHQCSLGTRTGDTGAGGQGEKGGSGISDLRSLSVLYSHTFRVRILMTSKSSSSSSSEIVLSSQGAKCTISTHGCQVTSFIPKETVGRDMRGCTVPGKEVFFMSKLEHTDKSKARRGGAYIREKILLHPTDVVLDLCVCVCVNDVNGMHWMRGTHMNAWLRRSSGMENKKKPSGI